MANRSHCGHHTNQLVYDNILGLVTLLSTLPPYTLFVITIILLQCHLWSIIQCKLYYTPAHSCWLWWLERPKQRSGERQLHHIRLHCRVQLWRGLQSECGEWDESLWRRCKVEWDGTDLRWYEMLRSVVMHKVDALLSNRVCLVWLRVYFVPVRYDWPGMLWDRAYKSLTCKYMHLPKSLHDFLGCGPKWL